MEPSPGDHRMPASAVWGSMLGCCLWAFLLTGMFLADGQVREAMTVGVPCILAGVGVGALTVLVASLALRVHGRSAQWQRLFFGTLWFQMGLLLLLGATWIVPSIESAGLLEEAGGLVAIRAPMWLSGCLLLVGVALLLLALRADRAFVDG